MICLLLLICILSVNCLYQGKSLSICCSALQWLKDNNKKNLEELTKEIDQIKLELANNAGKNISFITVYIFNVFVITNFSFYNQYNLFTITDSNDWLQEEYVKIKKNQTLINLQNKLDQIKKRELEFDELKKRVTKQSNNWNKNEHYFIKKEKETKTKSEEDLEEKENIDDQDLIVESRDNEGDESDSEELIVDNEANEDNNTKVSDYHTILS